MLRSTTTRLAILLSILALPISANAYDIEQFVADTQKHPERIYKNLHPDAKAYVDRGIELYQTNKAFREEQYIEFPKPPSKMKPAQVWSHIWADNGFTEYYANGYAIINTFDQGEWRYITVKEKGFNKEVIMLDTYVFRKSGDTYLFYPPGWIMDLYSPLDYLSLSSGSSTTDELPEAILKRLQENLTEEDKEAFRNAKSPAEAAELIKKLLTVPDSK